MGGNSKSNFMTITVSPQNSPLYTVSRITAYAEAYALKYQKSIVNYAYCVETGKKSNHPHVHLLVQFLKERRADKVKEQCLRFTTKWLAHPFTPCLVCVKRAFNAYNYLDVYMKKENLVFVNRTFDLSILKERDSEFTEHMRVSALGTMDKKVTRCNFAYVYRELLQSGNVRPLNREDVEQDESEYYTSVIRAFEAEGFQIHFFFWNKRQVWNLIEYICGDPIKMSFSIEGGVSIS